jgi:RimJ/RimL family protein N-acetyltransferase
MSQRRCESGKHREERHIQLLFHRKSAGTNPRTLGRSHHLGEDNGLAEFSVSLRPEAQTLGLASGALEAILHAAHRKGFNHVWGTIAVQNAPMIALARRLGFNLLPDPDDTSLIRADIELPAPKSLVVDDDSAGHTV